MSIIHIEDLCFSYPQSEVLALDHVSLDIEEGDFVVLCGKSGCGKSTLLRHLKSVLTPHGRRSGTIAIDGKKIEEMDHREQSETIGYVLQNPDNQIVTDKVWHELAFGLESLGFDQATIRLRVAEMASYFGIQDWFYRNVTELSGGQKQLLNLASIMAMHPRVLVLDEPTSQLDPIAASDFLETIRKINRDLGMTIVMTEHRLEDIFPAADQVLVMDEGKILTSGTPREIAKELRGRGHEMFLSMPAPMQIYAAVDNDLECPLTVREGRKWLSRLAGMKNMRPGRLKPVSDKFAQEETIIEAKDVWFRYEKNGNDIVRDLSFQVKKGEFFALVGGNGTGKSTTLSMISNINRPYRGKIKLAGKDIRKYSDKELFNGFLGVLPQNPQALFVRQTVEDELYEVLGGRREKRGNTGMSKKEMVAGIASLMHLDNQLTQHPYDLSGGEQQRLALGKIMLLKPKILLLDEPTKGLDNHFKQELADILKRLQAHGVTILMVSHDLEFCAQYADRCGLFFEGNIVTDAHPREFFSGNSFYTTSVNRLARHLFPNAVTVKDVIECCQMSL